MEGEEEGRGPTFQNQRDRLEPSARERRRDQSATVSSVEYIRAPGCDRPAASKTVRALGFSCWKWCCNGGRENRN